MNTPAATNGATTAPECRCLIAHAITGDDRLQVTAALTCARAIGDTTGILLALARLTGSCPARGNHT